METRVLKTPRGEIEGLYFPDKAMLEFRGIRYASAERFEYPVETIGWEGVYDATRYGDCCCQYRYFNDEFKRENPFYSNEFRKGSSFTYSEDCLNLNICAPENAKDCPVIMFIHGGNFIRGSSDEKQNDGAEFVKNGVILVTVNYRLGVYGLYADRDKKKADGFAGNCQLYDQLTAVKWIKNNISAYGGNPEKITVIGQSAGAMCTQSLILSPLAEGLISGAVMMSGGGMRRGSWAPYNIDRTLWFWKRVMKKAGCGSIGDLKKVSSKELYDAWIAAGNLSGVIATLPMVDGRIMPFKFKKLFASDKNRVPTVIGVTKNDMVPYILFSDAKRYAAAQTARGVDNYLYYFDTDLPGDGKGAFHSCDLWYMFKSLAKSERPFREKDYALAEKLCAYISNFAKNQNPNGEGLPLWEKAQGQDKEFLRVNADKVEMCRPPAVKLLLNTVRAETIKDNI